MPGKQKERPVPQIMWCRSCGKIHRIRNRELGLDGLPLQRFLFSCVQCGKSEIRHADEIMSYSNHVGAA